MRRPKGEPEASWEPIGAVRPDPRNARRHPPDQVRRIAASLARFGWGRPLLARLDGTLLAGHGTLLAARWLESDGSDDEDQALAQRYREVSGPAGHVLVRRLDLTPQQARELGLLDNALPSFGEDLDAMIEGVLREEALEYVGQAAVLDLFAGPVGEMWSRVWCGADRYLGVDVEYRPWDVRPRVVCPAHVERWGR